MAQALDERKRAILGAVVEQYVRTGQPVSSASVTRRAGLGVCAATVRHEMAQLERSGHLSHPHTSAGRVPTDRGYRAYVEAVMNQVEGAVQCREFGSLRSEGGIEPALAAACQALARLTCYLSLAQPPSWSDERLRYLHLSRLDGRRVLALLVTQGGRVHHGVMESRRAPSPAQLRGLSALISERFAGHALRELTEQRLQQALSEVWDSRAFAERVARLLAAALPRADESTLMMEGTSHLLEAQEFQRAEIARQVFDMIEQRAHLRQVLAQQQPGVAVLIGERAGHPALRHCALMLATFDAPSGGLGRLGVLGPKRMRYRPALGALLWAARAVRRACVNRFSD